MRHETCLYCRARGAGDQNIQALILVAESVGDLTHHHHTVKCPRCGTWWFDDLVTGALGVPVPSRRDTILCPCPDDGPLFTLSAVMVPVPESECACTKAEVDRQSLAVNVGRQPSPRKDTP